MTGLFLIGWLIGCRHQVKIDSTPYGADVIWKEESIGTTPMTHTFWWYPGRKLQLDVQKYGYRPMYLSAEDSISLRYLIGDVTHFRFTTLLGFDIRSTHTAVMIPEHGPAGTWTPEDAQSFQ